MKEANGFSYRVVKDDTVFISFRGRDVTTLRGEPARHLVRRAEGADEAAVQQLLARATGNFKRGNER